MLVPLLCSLALLTSCGLSNDKPLVISTAPAAMTQCKMAPPIPAGPYMQGWVADYINDLYFAWLDCRTKLEAVRNLSADPLARE